MMDPSAAPDGRFDTLLAELVRAREEGLIVGIGLSNISRQQLLRAVAQTEIVCVQNLFNLADQRSLDVLTECTTRGIAFVPFCPLGWPAELRHQILASPVLAALAARLRATPARSPSPGCSTSHPASCSSREPAPALIWPRISAPPMSNSTTQPARS